MGRNKKETQVKTPVVNELTVKQLEDLIVKESYLVTSHKKRHLVDLWKLVEKHRVAVGAQKTAPLQAAV